MQSVYCMCECVHRHECTHCWCVCPCVYDPHAQAIWLSISSPRGELFERLSLSFCPHFALFALPSFSFPAVRHPSSSFHICLHSHFPSLPVLPSISPRPFFALTPLHTLLTHSISLAHRCSLENAPARFLRTACVWVFVCDSKGKYEWIHKFVLKLQLKIMVITKKVDGFNSYF